MSKPSIHTLGELKASGWVSCSVKDEMRRNVMNSLSSGEPLFPGIYGYEKSVLPQLVNAILARHDLILLGLRGQAKTRILRSLSRFLDEYIPVVEGSEIQDDPLSPISHFAKVRIAEMGDETPINWLHRSHRYGEKLATPDTTVSDLIGDIDPIKAAAQKLSLNDEQVIHYGLLPRSNRGLFVINELPDLQPRIQVALLNIMQERDIQIRGFTLRLPLDIVIAFSANPEDYTNRGNIITPLKDRIDAQIITHYPKELQIAKQITAQEAWMDRSDETSIYVPNFYRDLVEWVAFEARESEYIDQKSGVSARMTITAMEQLISSAEQRAYRNKESHVTLRISDLYHMVPALTGKLELVYEGEQEGAIQVAKHLIGKAVLRVFTEHFPAPNAKKARTKEGSTSHSKDPYEGIRNWFAKGGMVEFSDEMTEQQYRTSLEKVEGLSELLDPLLQEFRPALTKSEFEAEQVAWKGLVLEALHQYSILGKEDLDDVVSYSDMVGSVLGRLGSLDEEEEEID